MAATSMLQDQPEGTVEKEAKKGWHMCESAIRTTEQVRRSRTWERWQRQKGGKKPPSQGLNGHEDRYGW